ncbi:hypothetical protein H8356DRAFT_1435045 [Neocallimastix lanati (nom. inval.)]|nr:hypothetical protein H8356DRAFT_1435045 [Neocallimastix sp. JGI-2020a]
MLNSQIELLKFENDTKITYLKNSLKKKSESKIEKLNEIITLKEEYNKLEEYIEHYNYPRIYKNWKKQKTIDPEIFGTFKNYYEKFLIYGGLSEERNSKNSSNNEIVIIIERL